MCTIEKNDWLLDMQCSHWCRDAWEDVPSCPLFVHLAYQWSFLFVCIVGLYAGHPYIHLISFEIFLLACPVYILYKPSWITFPSAINVQFPHIVFGTELNTLACGISSPLVGSSCSPGTEHHSRFSWRSSKRCSRQSICFNSLRSSWGKFESGKHLCPVPIIFTSFLTLDICQLSCSAKWGETVMHTALLYYMTCVLVIMA